MIYCDIGNTTVDIFENGVSRKLSIGEFHPESLEGEVWFASVNRSLDAVLEGLESWHNIADLIDRNGYYATMGIDRILVCEAVEEGVIVDAGSAITVDVMKNGTYAGGFISLGLRAAAEAYARLSPALAVSFNFEVDLTIMAKNTPDAVTIGFLAPLLCKIEELGKPLYLTGGDAEVLKHFLPHAVADKELLFKGMQKLIEKGCSC